MAMIKCPKCNEEISDKSKKCVHCGYVLVEEEKKVCPECGEELRKNAKECPKCGCPVEAEEKTVKTQQVEVTSINIKPKISKKKLIIIIAAVVAVIIGGIIVKTVSDKRAESAAIEASEKYKTDLNTISLKMLNGAAKAEGCGNKIKSVWSNTIWNDDDPETDKYTKVNGKFNDDFNDSLSALFIDPDFIKITDSVESTQKEVTRMMKDMKNPPEEWKDAYDDLKDYYDDFITLTNLCTNPSGSLQTYSNNFSEADSDTVNGWEKMKTYLDY